MPDDNYEDLIDANEDINSSDFRIPASDLRGHSTPQYFRMPGGLMYQVAIILESKKFPYKMKGELFRHAILRHLKWLATLKPVRSVLAEAEAIMDILREEENAEMFKGVFDKLGSRIAVFLGSGEKGEALRLVRLIQNRLINMEDGYWKTRYMNELEEEYGFLLENATKANLGVDEEEDGE